jgi:hypothetical protein
MSGVTTLARKKAMPPPDSDSEARVAIILLKGSREYASWLDAVNKKTRVAKAAIFRQAVEEWAEKRGIDAPPSI